MQEDAQISGVSFDRFLVRLSVEASPQVLEARELGARCVSDSAGGFRIGGVSNVLSERAYVDLYVYI